MMFDTFIGDDSVWDTIKENMRIIYKERDPYKKLGFRKEVAANFYDFLELRLEKLVAEARNRGLPPQWCLNALTRVKADFQEGLVKALNSAKRNYGPDANAQTTKLPLFQAQDSSLN